MPHRSYASTANYRFGFNGKENDNDPKGLGNQIEYTNRIYDSRLGRFLSVDPLQKKFAWLTPYQFAGNSPVSYNDPFGDQFTQNGRLQQGPDGEYHVGWLSDMMWENQNSFSWNEWGSSGGSGGGFSMIIIAGVIAIVAYLYSTGKLDPSEVQSVFPDSEKVDTVYHYNVIRDTVYYNKKDTIETKVTRKVVSDTVFIRQKIRPPAQEPADSFTFSIQ